MPFFLKVTVTVPDCPGSRNLVALPLQLVSRALLTGVAQTLNRCQTDPSFLTLNVTVDGRGDDFDSVKENSSGRPALTVTTVGFAASS